MHILKKMNVTAFTAGIFAIALQVHLTLFSTENYDGLRISAGDFFLPFTGLLIAASLFSRRSLWPQWRRPFGWWWLPLTALVMTSALINGYLVQGSFSQWALANKFAGWFVLMAYFCAAGWFRTNYGEKFLKPFLKCFFVFFMLTLSGEVVIKILKGHGIPLSLRDNWQSFEGFMDNRNVFAFLFVCAASFIVFYKPKQPSWLVCVFWILAPITVLFSASRTLLICLIPLCVFFVFYDWRNVVKVILPCTAFGTILFFTIFSENQVHYFSNLPISATKNMYVFSHNPEDPVAQEIAKKTGNQERLDIIKQAIGMIKERPILGSGLGSTIYFQKKETGSLLNIIDSTPLWLLTETGLAGFLIFAACYITMLTTLIRNVGGSIRVPDDSFSLWIAVVLLSFGIFSLFHELLYTRFLWFLLGLALVRPRQNEPAP